MGDPQQRRRAVERGGSFEFGPRVWTVREVRLPVAGGELPRPRMSAQAERRPCPGSPVFDVPGGAGMLQPVQVDQPEPIGTHQHVSRRPVAVCRDRALVAGGGRGDRLEPCHDHVEARASRNLAEVVGLELRATGSSSASDQRSTISRVEVEFDGNVDIADNAFALTERRTGRAVQTNVQERPLANGNTVVELSFSGALTRGVGALVDGDYQLVIDSSQVTRVGSNVTLDGDGDGLVGGNYQFGNVAADRFFALYGDQDGDGDVDAQDMGRFALSFMKQSSDPAFDPVWDFDGDGDVDGNDLGQLELRLYRRL